MDIYLSPESFNLEKIAELDRSTGYYEFDLLVIWQDKDSKKLYYATDSGCSYPSPFESIGRNDLQLVNSDFQIILDSWWKGNYGPEGNLSNKLTFESKIREIINDKSRI